MNEKSQNYRSESEKGDMSPSPTFATRAEEPTSICSMKEESIDVMKNQSDTEQKP